MAALLGYELPAPTTVRDFLEAFHVEDPPLWRAGETAAVPQEAVPLTGVGRASQQVITARQRQAPQPTATLDIDATLVASEKRTATVAYDGTRGYQPVVAVWAEQDLILHDEFRDGHVPAGCGNGRIVERAVAALPPGVTRSTCGGIVRGMSGLCWPGVRRTRSATPSAPI